MLKKGIKRKLVLSLVLTILVVVSIFIAILDRNLKDYSKAEAEKTIRFLGSNTSTLLQKPLFNGDYNEIKVIARTIILEDFDYLFVLDNTTGNIAFSEDRKELAELLDFNGMMKNKPHQGIDRLKLKGENYTQYVFPVSVAGVSKPLGFLLIGVSEDKTESKLGVITFRIGIISILLFITLTILIYLLSDRIVKPVKNLSLKIEKFASGDYSVRSDIKTDDEIGGLSDNFNFMADKINEQIISIEQYSKNLERMVEERTGELLKALDSIREKDTKLIQAEKINSLNSIVSSIAHEINNPLAIISGNLQLLQPRSDDPVFQKKLKAAGDGVDRIARLIAEINFFAAIKDTSTTPLRLGKLVSDAARKVVPDNFPLHIDAAEDDEIQSNSYLLSVSIENILKNSVEMIKHKRIENNGKIGIRYYRDIPYFILEITDNAGGFEEPLRAFDPFYTTFEYKKGLGLTFAYHAIQALNGEITVENVDGGAKVTLMLPVEIPDSDEKIWPS
jgi:signal transduction histidine kinase